MSILSPKESRVYTPAIPSVQEGPAARDVEENHGGPRAVVRVYEVTRDACHHDALPDVDALETSPWYLHTG